MFSELLDMDLPMVAAVLDAMPQDSEGERLGRALRIAFLGK